MKTNTNVYPVLKFFEHGHLPEKLQWTAKTFHNLAHDFAYNLDQMQNDHGAKPVPELEMGLRKLLEAKDCFIRATL